MRKTIGFEVLQDDATMLVRCPDGSIRAVRLDGEDEAEIYRQVGALVLGILASKDQPEEQQQQETSSEPKRRRKKARGASAMAAIGRASASRRRPADDGEGDLRERIKTNLTEIPDRYEGESNEDYVNRVATQKAIDIGRNALALLRRASGG